MLDQDSSIKLSRNSAGVATQGHIDARLVPTLLSIAKSTRAFLALLLAEIDLHPGQDQLLHRLEPGETVSVSMLADQLAVRPSTVSKMLDRLIEKELVVRAANNRDARRTMVALTPRGEEIKQAVRRIWNRLEHELTASLSSTDMDRLIGAVEQVDDLLSVKLRRLR
ncbi:MarR family transcriptional regulator [Aureimonas sp. Leaf454]|uniref:MarR family winged helix-turn-helix transcriptional regulator n=1 Tax=Aureimonas sp. Leaf454 TaxID=1736381 RepID=UPI000ABB40E6|nr:MarR family transcriptional regulator [Aureimonas sp. Leaf454]